MAQTLKTYLNAMGIVGFGTSTEGGSLKAIGRFEFGDFFQIVLLSGARIEFSNLHDLLEVFSEEFKMAPTFSVDVRLERQGRSRMGDILVALPKDELGRPWGRNIRKTCEDIQLWVAGYTLSGVWQEDIPRSPMIMQTARWER